MILPSQSDLPSRDEVPSATVEAGATRSKWLIWALALGLSGCASPGVPRPPSLHLPATITDLTAKRSGDHVELQWTSPRRTTDGLDLTTPTTVEICRDLMSPSPSAAVPTSNSPCTAVMSMAGHPGVSTATDQLPPPITNPAAARSLIGYRIRVLNQSGRSAPPSATVLVPGGSPPPVVAGFRTSQRRDGVVLEWQRNLSEAVSPDRQSAVEVLRTVQASPGAETQDAAPPQTGKVTKKHDLASFSRLRKESNAVEIRLRQPGGAPSRQTKEWDGMVDRSTLPNLTYTYTAQRVWTVSSAGKTVEIRSEPTTALAVETRDKFPPAPPIGLVSVPGTASPSSGGTLRHGTIDLAWEPNTETDLAGYLVYRTDLANGTPDTNKPIRLTATPIPGSTYRDATVLPGRRYAYRITAVDRMGNESTLSVPVEDTPDSR